MLAPRCKNTLTTRMIIIIDKFSCTTGEINIKATTTKSS